MKITDVTKQDGLWFVETNDDYEPVISDGYCCIDGWYDL